MDNNAVLEGQRALVTGSSSGIGKVFFLSPPSSPPVAIRLAGAGAKVVVNYRAGGEKAARVVEEIKDSGGEAIAIQADVSREYEVQEMFRQTAEAWGSIGILVNNAGVQKDAPFHEMTLEDWNTALAVDLTGQFLCSREAVREFKRIGSLTNWVATCLVTLTFLTLTGLIGISGTFWLYGFFAVVTLLLFYFFIPKTKGLRLEEIEEHWRSGKKAREMGK